MMIKQVFLLLAIALIILPIMVWRQLFKFPFDINPAADNSFGATLSKKDDSFSNVLSKDDEGFARALKPREFSFPADHGARNIYHTEGWYVTGNLKNSYNRKFGYELTFSRVLLNLFTFSVRGEPLEPHICFLQVPPRIKKAFFYESSNITHEVNTVISSWSSQSSW